MSSSMTFIGFGIRIDILSQAALFAFKQMSMKAAILAGIISQLAKEVLEFEKAMASVERMLAVTTGSLEGVAAVSGTVRDQILTMSADSIFSTEQLADSFEYLLRAGLNVQQSMEELYRTEQLALATGMDLNEAAETRIRLMKMWGAEMFIAIGLNDQLVKIEQLFTMTTEQLATAMNTAGAVAKLAGLSFAQTAVVIGELVAAGIEASTAGTTLRNVLKALVAPSESVKTAINELNLSWTMLAALPVDERMRQTAQAILDLNDDAAMLNKAFEIFGLRGSNVAAILDTLATSWDGQAASILAATGNAALAAQVFRDNLHTRLVELGNALTAGMIRFGEWAMAADNAKIIALTLAVGLGLLIAAKMADTKATIGALIWDKISAGVKMVKTALISGETAALWSTTVALKTATKAEGRSTVGKVAAGTATGLMAIISTVYTATLGFMTMALKAAGSAARQLNTALGPVGIILMIVGAALAMVSQDADIMAEVMAVLSPLMDDFADIWGMLGEVLDMLMMALKPVLKMLGMILLPVIGMLMIPLKLIIGQFKIMMPILMLLMKPMMMLFQWLGKLMDNTTFLTTFMGWLGTAMEAIGNVINIIVDGIIWLINWIGKLFNLDLGMDIGVEDTATTEEREAERAEQERLDAEAKVDKQKALGSELQFDEDIVVDTDPTDSPTTTPETGDDGGTGGGGYGSGGGGGTGPLSITIYIQAMLDDIINTESFAEYVAQYAMAEVAKSRGTGMI